MNTAANFAADVHKHGDTSSRIATTAAQQWRVWADRLDQLARQIPGSCCPTYMDECGDRCSVDLGVDAIVPSDMKERLHRVRAQADALAAAYARGAGLVDKYTAATVAEVAGSDGGDD